ncbi:enoyl-CoA hydratase [Blastochloris viridis]|uniref:Enoyl-CoA hydratase domain-containing protein 3, mitochondrial n=1 Tax=Blastochloris viridis TaxID=1079 RepID=A0A0H5BI78_BLAVI|nr:enoyl-CoA hydratase [Blastochloris viridis]ALK09977.1 putative enoyl-CoA hydratase echA8 [Blastochloris viridis]BAS00107.1 enoyl-CoA hydratase [Blastochloris viridis]CUU42640.1 putative enoyl-CoA hydratase echA8 [Blastochloris viridis]
MTTATPETCTPPLARRRDGAIEVLTLSRPASRNSLSEAMLAALAEALADIKSDRAVRAVVLAADGPVFSAGHDLKEMTAARGRPDRGHGYFVDVLGRCAAVMQAIVHLPQPVIAAVAGTATAAGCQLVASCDLAVAAREAKFCTPGVNIGLFCSTPMVALSRNVGAKHALEMLLTGDMIDAETARSWGLVNRVVAKDEVLATALALANQIAAKSAYAVKIGKEAFYRQRELSLSEAYAYATRVMTENMLAHDAEEGIAAFIEKRNPTWADR